MEERGRVWIEWREGGRSRVEERGRVWIGWRYGGRGRVEERGRAWVCEVGRKTYNI